MDIKNVNCRNGVLTPGDKVRYWSKSYKDWREGEVSSITLEWYEGYEPELKVKFRAPHRSPLVINPDNLEKI